MIKLHSRLPGLRYEVVAPPGSIQALSLFERDILQGVVFFLLEALCDHDQVKHHSRAQVSLPVHFWIPFVRLSADLQSASSLVVSYLPEEAMHAYVDVPQGSILKPQAWPSDICDSDFCRY